MRVRKRAGAWASGAIVVHLATCGVVLAQVSSPDQICPPTADPCIVNTIVELANRATLDFGPRQVRIEGNGQLDVLTGAVTLYCGSFVVDTGTNVGLKLRGPAPAGGIEGGSLAISARRSCSNDPERECLADADCATGTCTHGTGSISIDGRVRAEGQPPGALYLDAGGEIELLQSISLNATSGLEDGGILDVVSRNASITVRGKVDARGGSESQGGDVYLGAGRDVVVAAEIDVDGGDFDGGYVELEAGRDIVVLADLRASSISGEGFGGEIYLSADRDVDIPGPARLSANGHESLDLFCGDAGPIEIYAEGDIEIGSTTVLESTGPMPDCGGDQIVVEAGGSLTVRGTIDAHSRAPQGEGGLVSLVALRDIDIPADATVDVTGGASEGEIEVIADGDVFVGGTLDARVPGDIGGVVSVRGGGAVEIAGTVATGGVSGIPGLNGLVDIEGCTLDVLPGAQIESEGDRGVNRLIAHAHTTVRAGARILADVDSGQNRFEFRDASDPPDVAGLVEPAAQLVVAPGLPQCLVCGNGILEHEETCDDGNTTSGDGCTADCVRETCIAETPGYPSSSLCDDGNPCTVDACNPALGHCASTFEPQPICQVGKAAVLVEDRFTDSGDRLRWKWRGISGTGSEDFGRPDQTTDLALCIYDHRASEPVLATVVAIPAGALWKASRAGFSYKDRDAANDGVSRMRMLAVAGGVSKILVKSGGPNVPIPSAVSDETLLAQDPEVTVQLVNSEGMCWTSSFVPQRTKERSRLRFKAVAR